MHELTSECLASVVAAMRAQGVRFKKGLLDRQVSAAERLHSFTFPSDLPAFLQFALTVGECFPDWRKPGSALIHDSPAWPAQGICFAVEYNDFWMPT